MHDEIPHDVVDARAPEVLAGEPVESRITEQDLRGRLSVAEIRLSGRWSSIIQSLGDVHVTDLAERRPALFGETDAGVLFLRSWCVHCRREIRLPLEGTFKVAMLEEEITPAEREKGVVYEAVALGRGMLSRAALVFAQRMACEPCRARLEREEEKRDRRGRLEERLSASKIPASLAAEVSWETLIEKGGSPQETAHRKAAIAAAREWSGKKRPERGLLFWGPTGSGKTRLAATCAMARLEHSPIRWVSVAVLIAELQQAWGDEDRRRALEVLTSKAPVVLDDLDKVNPTEGVRTQLFAALDKREQARTPIIVTTNLKPSELEGKLSSVLVHRLVNMCTVYPYPGLDRRLEIGEGA